MLNRKRAVSRRLMYSIAAVTVSSLSTNAAYATNYVATNLSALGSGVVVLGLNDSDQVVGYESVSGTNVPFVYTPGTGITAIPGVGGNSTSRAVAINNAGQVVGNDGSNGDGFVYSVSTGALTEISPVSGTGGTLTFSGVNSSGVAVGTSSISSGVVHAVTYNPSTAVVSNAGVGYSFTGGSTYGSSINNAGVIAGMGIAVAAAGSSNPHYQPFIATPIAGGGYSYTNVGTAAETKFGLTNSTYPTYDTTPAPQIDSQGNVAGAIGTNSSNTYGGSPNSAYGFLYNNSGGVTSLNYTNNPSINGIADVAGVPQVIGTYYSRGVYAFIFSYGLSGSSAYSYPAVSGYTLSNLIAINSKGDLLATSGSTNLLLTAITATVTYTGGTSANWDGTAGNFTPSAYADGDNVIFNDSSTGSTSVNIPSAVAPGNVTFNNNSKNYTISGASIGGTSSNVLTVSGTGTVTLNNINTFTGPTNVSSGTLIIGSGGSIASTTLNITGGTLKLQSPASLSSQSIYNQTLILNVGGTLVLQNSSSGLSASPALIVNTLNIAGATNNWTGKFDLGNNGFLMSSSRRRLFSQVYNQLKSGYAGGTWLGNGIDSSAAAADTSHLTALGIIINSSDQSGVTAYAQLYTSFHGTNTSLDDVLVGYTYYGDTNLDGQVDGSDYSRIDSAFLNNQNSSNVAMTGWFNGDFNYDGVIDGSDYTLIDNAFNTQGGNLGGGTNPGAGNFARIATEIAPISTRTAVPEPPMLALYGFLSLGLLGRRKSKQK